ncbi:hypothetical protein GWK08_10175 [Leptobacterium flavescens]|uniref:Uncharacterized protein n=1 Tax=Leptobacterium flavescens TaxID=472055 RepID=A0A6P0ULF4_9FLAO|nr:hypothetical protein [Leptobacterium flavescens]NER13807.1 hypothetical protein [Leptobacterium flavescens]
MTTNNSSNKFTKLFLGLVFDAMGYVSFIIPGIGEFSDIIWAPLAAWLMTRMYKGTSGQIAGVVAFVEELMPGLDIVPTFTLMWIYTYVLRGKKADKAIEV